MNVRTCIAAIVVLAQCAVAHPATLHAQVVGVSDGDTLTALDASHRQWKIRLAGIDAPEKSQPLGQQSKQALSDRVHGRQVVIDAGKTDRYGRTIGKVWVDGRDANLAQIRDGLAWHYKKYESEQTMADRFEYAHAESDARQHRRGVWRLPEPVAPWDYRFQRRGK